MKMKKKDFKNGTEGEQLPCDILAKKVGVLWAQGPWSNLLYTIGQSTFCLITLGFSLCPKEGKSRGISFFHSENKRTVLSVSKCIMYY